MHNFSVNARAAQERVGSMVWSMRVPPGEPWRNGAFALP